MPHSPTIIFDGVCNLCNSSVDWIIRHDKKGIFKFTANQHETGSKLLEGQHLPDGEADTIFLYEDGKLFTRSTAVLRIARKLPFPWFLGFGGMIFPRFFRDWIYKWVAKNRYKWFGKKNTCRIPTPEERARFI
ncbi:MAG: thiol-disulfide oxidoreductase DCC family protein [Bacteroidia bacterium]|nr:thiol-disulfide oxidoreductase DCC family protein [Bacteroidia bacterium]